MMQLHVKTPCAQESSTFNYSCYFHFYVPSIFDDIRLHAARSYTSFRDSRVSLISPPHSTQPFSSLPPPSNFHWLHPASYVVLRITSTSFPAQALRLRPLSLSLSLFDLLSRQALPYNSAHPSNHSRFCEKEVGTQCGSLMQPYSNCHVRNCSFPVFFFILPPYFIKRNKNTKGFVFRPSFKIPKHTKNNTGDG